MRHIEHRKWENLLQELHLRTHVLLARSRVATARFAKKGLTLILLQPGCQGRERVADVVRRAFSVGT